MIFKSFDYGKFKIVRGYINLDDSSENDATISGKGFERKHILSIEMVHEKDYNYIDNIYIDSKYRNKGYLRKIINYLKSHGYESLICLPLPKHVEKFKHLGFIFYEKKGDDVYYILR